MYNKCYQGFIESSHLDHFTAFVPNTKYQHLHSLPEDFLWPPGSFITCPGTSRTALSPEETLAKNDES